MDASFQAYLDNVVLDIFNNTDRQKDFDAEYKTIYLCDKSRLITLMFYLRSIAYGRGEKDLSYDIALWILNYDPNTFTTMYNQFIELGCLKDCLHLAKRVIMKSDDKSSETDEKVNKLLKPFAEALMSDEREINHRFMTQLQNPINLNVIPKRIEFSLAAKWAPRQGKTFTCTIPYLKKMCEVSNKNSNAAWRKYIQYITNSCIDVSIETKLSNWSPKLFKKTSVSLTNKSAKLYKNVFKYMQHTRSEFSKKLLSDNIIIDPHSIYNITSGHVIDEQVSWNINFNSYTNNCFINNNETQTYLPIINMNASMLHNFSKSMRIAMTLGTIMSGSATNVFKHKAVSFSSEPYVFDIGDMCISSKITNIYNAIAPTKSETYILDYGKMLSRVLEHCLVYGASQDVVRGLSIVIFSSGKLRMSKAEHIRIVKILNKFTEYGFATPKLIYWNLAGDVDYHSTNKYGIDCIAGFNKNIFANFIENGSVDITTIPFKILEEFKQLL